MIRKTNSWDIIKKRVLNVARYIMITGATIREAASVFFISKSTVHKDVTVLLKSINWTLYEEVKKVLDKNKSERYIRGGMATKRRWQAIMSDGRA